MTDEDVRAFPEIAAVPEAREGDRPPGLDNVQRFLERFGYLQPGEYRPGELDTETARALAWYQGFNALEPTGRFDWATRDEMTRPRCAMPDVVSAAEFATTCHWNRRDLTYALDTPTPDVAGTAEWNAIRAAFATWQALGVLRFTEVGLNDNPDIRVGWRPANDPDLSMVGGPLAHADFPPACSVVTSGLPKPVHFDDSEHTWAIGAVAGAFDIETVALHEIGHIIGLAHSAVAGAVMLPTVASNVTRRALSQDDIDGYRELYTLVPDVRELRLTPAINEIRAAGLVPRISGPNTSQAWVYRQAPRAGTIVNRGAIVTLQMRTGPIP